jgi:hypothetical protein
MNFRVIQERTLGQTTKNFSSEGHPLCGWQLARSVVRGLLSPSYLGPGSPLDLCTMGTAAPPFNGGQQATHEIGHWLNLRHIWGDDPGCGMDDECTDTPPQAHPNSGCPTFPHVSCNNGPNGDMFTNFMDLTDDACMSMFTPQQVARMLATLEGPRSTLGQGNGS